MTPRHHQPLIARPETNLDEREPIHVAGYLRDAVGRAPAFDMHYAWELGVVLDGRVQRYCGSDRRACGPGDMWFCGMWEVHGFRVTVAPCRMLVVLIWPPLLAHQRFPEAPEVDLALPFTVPAARRPRVPASARPVVLQLAHRMLDHPPEPASARRLRLRLWVMELLLAAEEQAALRPPRDRAPADHSGIVPALDLAFRARRLITNEEAAQACAMSGERFIRLFQRLMGISFVRFALRHRLCGAAGDIARTDTPLKAIAQRWGFTDQCHLHHRFVEHYGCTPLEYRELHAERRRRTDDA